MRRFALQLITGVICTTLAACAFAQQSADLEPIVPTEYVVLPAVGQYGRLALHRDAVEAQPDATIHVSVRRVGPQIQYVVEDNGVGVDEKAAERLFEPFFTTKPVGRGMGLGLSLSHGIVRDHGGDLVHEARRPRGARFVVRLPVENQEAAS